MTRRCPDNLFSRLARAHAFSVLERARSALGRGCNVALKIIRPDAVAERFGISKSTVFRWAARPDFPRKYRLGPQVIGWDEAEIDEWARQTRVAERTVSAGA